MRFDSVSFSLDKQKVKKFLNYDQMRIMEGAPLEGRERCGISPLLDVFNIRESLVPRHLSSCLSHLGLWEEWSRLFPEITKNWGDLTIFSHEREANLGEKERKIREDLRIPIMPNLLDVFQFSQKTSFPRLWRFFMRNMTIIPTSVACEQSFSYFKRTRHTNIGDETAKIFLMARLSHYDYDYNL